MRLPVKACSYGITVMSGTYRYGFSPVVGLTRLSLVGSDPVAARQALATAPACRAIKGMLGADER